MAQPGSAEFKELLGLDHCWSRHVSFEASREKCGQGDVVPLLSDTILEFLRSVGGAKSVLRSDTRPPHTSV